MARRGMSFVSVDSFCVHPKSPSCVLERIRRYVILVNAVIFVMTLGFRLFVTCPLQRLPVAINYCKPPRCSDVNAYPVSRVFFSMSLGCVAGVTQKCTSSVKMEAGSSSVRQVTQPRDSRWKNTKLGSTFG